MRQQTIDDYEGESAVRQGEAAMIKYNNKQPGDVEKGTKVIVDVLTGRSGRDVPYRLVLGADANRTIRGKCEETIGLMEEWEDITTKTDLDV